jgi:hypothetical protein
LAVKAVAEMEKIRLKVAEITPGMKLAEPIANAGGVTLMPSGIRLTPMFISRIKKWNIDTICVFLDKTKVESHATSVRTSSSSTVHRRKTEDGVVPEAQEQFARAVATEVARIFVDVRDNELMMRLRALVIRRLVAKGPDSSIHSLRRGPVDEVLLPLPSGEDA